MECCFVFFLGEREDTSQGRQVSVMTRVIMKTGTLDLFFSKHPPLGLPLIIHVNHLTVYEVIGCAYFKKIRFVTVSS